MAVQRSYYLGGASYSGVDQTSRFIKDQIWETGYDDGRHERMILNMNRGDIIFLKSTYAKKTGESYLRIKGYGTIRENPNNGKFVRVNWELYSIKVDISEEPFNSYRSTLHQIDESEAETIITRVNQDSSNSSKGGARPKVKSIEIIPPADYQSSPTEIISETQESFLDVEQISEVFTNIVVKSSEKKQASASSQEDRFYGIFGQWGRGKTRLWKTIQKIIHDQHKDKFSTLEFHAWKYQDTEAIWAYLYESFANKYYWETDELIFKPFQYAVNIVQTLWLNFIRKPINLIYIILGLIGIFSLDSVVNDIPSDDSQGRNFSVLVAYIASIIAAFVGGIQTITKPIVAGGSTLTNIFRRKGFQEHMGTQHEIQKEFESLFEAWATLKTFVLFIDDIDRCREDRIINVVDSLRVMLNNPKIHSRLIVIAAIDERILNEAIRKKYMSFVEKGHLDVNVLSAEYLDKLFIAGIKLDELDNDQKEEILLGITDELTFREEDFIDDEEEDEIIDDDNLPNDNLEEGEKPIEEEEEKPREYQFHYNEQEKLKEAVKKLTNATPRSIRSFTVKYRIARDLIDAKLDPNSEQYTEWNQEDFHAQSVLAESLVKRMNIAHTDSSKTSKYLFSSELETIIERGVDMVNYYRYYRDEEESVNSKDKA